MTEKTQSHLRKNIGIGVLAGGSYGLLMRLGFEFEQLRNFLQIVSTAFLVGAPFAVGAVAVFVASKAEQLTIRQQVAVASSAMLFFLLAMFAFLLEGLICIVLIVPVFFMAAIIGGLSAGLVIKYLRKPKPPLYGIALLPLLLGPIEAQLPPASQANLVSTSIIIDASPAQVFDQLAAVKDIQPDELGFSFMHLIGLPRPVEAAMNGQGVGAVRTSRWEKGVSFKEEISVWERPHKLHYNFNIPPNSIPREALDRHVELGGEYFTVLNGGYDLEPTADGKTQLTLSTRYLNKSQLQAYGNTWGNIVLNDFHHSILGLMKNRAESANKLN
ncbi:MAG TPA: hypothetical protein VN030_12075 [Cellvibrio sp.]|nr:hypothetical protein [Cellvibrio sp.]